jgi:hypothetical protein
MRPSTEFLKREEASKVHRLKPKQYILALSTPLTPRRKDAIFTLIAPLLQQIATQQATFTFIFTFTFAFSFKGEL